MARRTNMEDYNEVQKADDLDRIVRDKRQRKRATKQKVKQRNRRYGKRMLSKLLQFGIDED